MENPQPPGLPNVEHETDAYLTLAWKAAIDGRPSVELADIIIKSPVIASPPVSDELVAEHPLHSVPRSIPFDTPVPKEGFVLQGEVDLFCTPAVGNLEKWIGPAPGPKDVNVGTDSPLPVIERVVIPVSLQNCAFDKTKLIGWNFNADWVIDPSCDLLYDLLRTALQVNELILNVHTAFGLPVALRWNAPLSLHSFNLEGVFPNLTLSPVCGLTLTTIGVRLLGIPGRVVTPEPDSTRSFSFQLFGTMTLDVPGSVVPLNLDYIIRPVHGTTVDLCAWTSDSVWNDALGVPGIRLQKLLFRTSLPTASPWKPVAFNVSATLSYLTSVTPLYGSCTAGRFSLSAELDNFGIKELNHLFFALFSTFLTLPDFEVRIGTAIISIVSGQGVSISLHNVDIAGYTVVSLEVALSSSGASLSGNLSRREVTFGDVELRDALIKLSLWINEKKKVDFTLCGVLDAEFLNLTTGAKVHLYPGENGVDWAIVAELNVSNRPFVISDLVPEAKDTFVDFSLRNAVFIAASKDDPLICRSFPEYHIRQGVQAFGVIDQIPAVNGLLRKDVKGLVLNAVWSKVSESSFSLSVSLPAEASLDLGNGIKTSPVKVGIRTDPPILAVSAGVTIPVKDPTPLHFDFVLATKETGASTSTQMKSWWLNPFGVDNLKIGPEMTLSVEIIHAQFAATGMPSEFRVSGGLRMGNTEAVVAMNVSEDPKRRVLFGGQKELNISDVVTFAGTLVQADIPHIPDNLLKFEDLKLHICPSGVVLGNTAYPQGFSFKANLFFFDQRADIQCTIDKVQKSANIIGGIDNLQLGPLTVRGFKGPRAKLGCHIGVSKQQLTIAGVVTLFDMDAQTLVDIRFLPEPTFKFSLLLLFARVFMYRLDAALLGSFRGRLSDTDFALHAELESDILHYIAQQMLGQFAAAKVAADEGMDAVQEKVDEAQKALEDTVAAAESKVEDTCKDWESYRCRVWSFNEPIIEYYNVGICRLQGELDNARQVHMNALDDAQKKVDQAERDRGVALATARGHVEETQRAIDNAVDEADQKLYDADADQRSAFGNAERDIKDVQREVDALQNELDGIQRTIREYEGAPWSRFDLRAALPGLLNAAGTLEARKDVALGVLDAARAIERSAEYASKEAAFQDALEAFDLAKRTGEASTQAAQAAVALTDETSNASVDAAKAFLEGVKHGPEFVACQGALRALEDFKRTHQTGYEAAIVAVEGLMDSAEYVGYNVAQSALEAANGSMEMLDATKEALRHVERALPTSMLSIVEQVLEFGSNAVTIERITLTGTLRGVLEIGGARPLSAAITGCILGRWFSVHANFDLREPVAFITAMFKQLWDMMCDVFGSDDQPTTTDDRNPTPSSPGRDAGPPRCKFPDASFTLLLVQDIPTAGVNLLQQRPDILSMLTEKSESILVDPPRGQCNGTPKVPSLVVAKMALVLMQEGRGFSFFDDRL